MYARALHLGFSYKINKFYVVRISWLLKIHSLCKYLLLFIYTLVKKICSVFRADGSFKKVVGHITQIVW